MIEDDVLVCHAWGLGPLTAAHRPATGLVHQTLLVRIGDDRYPLRSYRYTDPERIERERALIAHTLTRGLPVV